MGTNATVSIALIIAVITVGISVYNFFSNRDKKIKDESDGIIKANVKLDTICATVQDIKTDIKAMQAQYNALDKRLSIQERDMKTMWDKFDSLSERIEKL